MPEVYILDGARTAVGKSFRGFPRHSTECNVARQVDPLSGLLDSGPAPDVEPVARHAFSARHNPTTTRTPSD